MKVSGLRAAHARAVMVMVASTVVTVATVTGVVTTGDDRSKDSARPEESASPTLMPLPAVPTPSASPSPSPSPSPSATKKKPKPKPSKKPKPEPKPAERTEPVAQASDAALFTVPGSRVLQWVASNRNDPRRPLIESRIANQSASVWFAEYNPDAITGRVRTITSAAAAAGRIPVLVPYAIPNRDCGGASQGGAPSVGAYDGWIQNFAAGLGGGEVIVVLEPDSIALGDCLSEGQRGERYAALGRASRTIKAANPRARVYFDAGHSGWRPPGEIAGILRQVGANETGDGIFTNAANFHRTGDEVSYARQVLAALGGPAHLGAVIDTSRNGGVVPPGGTWCDPQGTKLGQPPTTRTGEARIDAYLWIKLPGESDGCRGTAGMFSPEYAYDLASG